MIKLTEVTKDFGKLRAVDKLSLDIEPGEIFGLLGPNGAGKTTVVRMLNTLTRPVSGQARVSGFDVVKSSFKVKQLIGVAPQEINLDKDLTARENLYIHGLLHRMDGIKERIDSLLAWSGLSERADDILRVFSGGMQRRLLIARAIMHQPRVLFLDEPTVGLDPQLRRQIWDLIRDLNRKGMTILLTTHYIEEAELLCHRVGILSRGKLIALGKPEELKAGTGHFIVELLDGGVTDYRLFETRQEAYDFAQTKADNVRIRESNLEDVFIKLTGKRIEG